MINAVGVAKKKGPAESLGADPQVEAVGEGKSLAGCLYAAWTPGQIRKPFET